MKIRKIKVVPFGSKRKLIELQNVTISTINENKMATGENQLWVLDKDGTMFTDRRESQNLIHRI